MSFETESTAGQGLLRRQTATDHVPNGIISVSIDQDDVRNTLEVVSSKTAQEILTVLTDEPHPASGVAEKVGASVQNVTYHLNRLDDAGIITPVETRYSKKGREMTVYGVSSEKLVIEFDSN
ncbi:ArsR family transcriptional regulator [Halogeometricum borinquense]|uniref:ArsR family transcriptional regulator n=1 Tax=Halogeometricum borinquense TaxID=60847 RepID=A0A482T201_9EURY|nr:winged helix-turn-helix domain-containing protein [Halogeometricum borinquense]RYJ08032.1 ArsR family transcriptional regulator [Halogeometricum borinquense]